MTMVMVMVMVMVNTLLMGGTMPEDAQLFLKS